MSILNRTLDGSQQRQAFHFNSNEAITAGTTGVLAYVPYPCVLQAAQIAAFNAQADINLLLTVTRFIVGTGVTTITLGSTFAPSVFGTSGVLAAGISLPASGSTLLNLMSNDVLGYVAGGTGSTAAIFSYSGCFVARAVQDSRVFLGLV